MNAVFFAALGLLGVERIAEVVYARRRARELVARGARFVRDDGMGLIAAVHVGLFVLALVEWTTAPWARIAWTSLVGVAFFVLGDALRFWAIAHLGPRWNTRVYVLDEPLVRSGPYRFTRHPNYVGVVLVLLGFPLVFHLHATAAIVGVANLVALRRRIGKEEAALAGGAAGPTSRA